MKPLHGKVVFLHDAAHSIARIIAFGLLEAGASVILSSRSHLKFEHYKERAQQLNALQRLHCLSFSVTTSDEMLLAKKAILRGWGGLDAVIALPENLHNCSELSNCAENDWDKAFNQTIKLYFALARSFIPVLALRKPSLYITVSSSSVASTTCTGLSMENLSHAVQFMMAQALCLESKDNPSLHNIVLSTEDTMTDAWITPSNVDAALVTLIRNAAWNRGYPEFQNNWRDRMEEPEPNTFVGGI